MVMRHNLSILILILAMAGCQGIKTPELEEAVPSIATLGAMQNGNTVQLEATVRHPDGVVECGFYLNCEGCEERFFPAEMSIVDGTDPTGTKEEKLGKFKTCIDSLKDQTEYSVRAFVSNGINSIYSDKWSFVTGAAPIGYLNPVDLGLSVNWSGVNLGATAPWYTGDYYGWGELETHYKSRSETSYEPFAWIKGGYCEENYRWYAPPEKRKFSKYNATDSLTALLPEDDIATVKLGEKWHTPSQEEWEELLDNCDYTPYSANGVDGLLFTSRVPGYTDKSIFFPLTGYILNRTLIEQSVFIACWSSDIYHFISGDGKTAKYEFYSGACFTYDTNYYPTINQADRPMGACIRPVCNK